jgi:hypothetical protein
MSSIKNTPVTARWKLTIRGGSMAQADVVLIVAALIPMVPLVGTAIPFTEILSKVAELMV